MKLRNKRNRPQNDEPPNATDGNVPQNNEPPNAADRNVPPPSKRLQFGHADMIKVIVGSEKVPFDIHKQLVCNASAFFRRACNGGFKEAQTGKVNLPEEEPEIFDIFTRCLYKEDLDLPAFPRGENRNVNGGHVW